MAEENFEVGEANAHKYGSDQQLLNSNTSIIHVFPRKWLIKGRSRGRYNKFTMQIN